MISLGKEPEGLLLRKADIMAWLPGLSEEAWDKIQPHLRQVYVPGGASPRVPGQRPYYPKEDVRHKLVNPILQEAHYEN